MVLNRGKQFEVKFKNDWIKTVPNSSIDRIYDSMSGYHKISNISDFICYKYPNIFYIECKSILGNTFPLSNLSQYDKLITKLNIPGVRVGVVIWFIDHCRILYVPIKTIYKLKKDNLKSVNINKIQSKDYKILEIPVIPKQIFLDADYSVMTQLLDGD